MFTGKWAYNWAAYKSYFQVHGKAPTSLTPQVYLNHHSKYTRDNSLKQILKSTVKSFKRKQTTERLEDCPLDWRDGKICVCTMLTILLLYTACLCYKLRVYSRSYAIRTKFKKPYRYLSGYLKSCDYHLYCSKFTSLAYFADGLRYVGGWSRFILIQVSISTKKGWGFIS